MGPVPDIESGVEHDFSKLKAGEVEIRSSLVDGKSEAGYLRQLL